MLKNSPVVVDSAHIHEDVDTSIIQVKDYQANNNFLIELTTDSISQKDGDVVKKLFETALEPLQVDE